MPTEAFLFLKPALLGRIGFTKIFLYLTLPRHWWNTKTATFRKHWQNLLLVTCFAMKSNSCCPSLKDFLARGGCSMHIWQVFVELPSRSLWTPWALLALASPELLELLRISERSLPGVRINLSLGFLWLWFCSQSLSHLQKGELGFGAVSEGGQILLWIPQQARTKVWMLLMQDDCATRQQRSVCHCPGEKYLRKGSGC